MNPCIPPICRSCVFSHIEDTTCMAFPVNIPDDILSGRVRHIVPYPGDGGIVFRRNIAVLAYYLAGDQPAEILFRITDNGSYQRFTPLLGKWEENNGCIVTFLEKNVDFRRTDESGTRDFIDQAKERIDLINPCSLQIMRMQYRYYQNLRNE